MMTDLIPMQAAANVEGMIGAWLHAKASKSHRTRGAYTGIMAQFRGELARVGLDLDRIDARLYGLESADHSTTMIALIAQAWAGRGDPAPATFNHRLAVVSSFYAYALRQGLLHGADPLARVDRRKSQSYAQAKALDYERIDEALKGINRASEAGARDYAILAVALATGQRGAELAAMNVGDIERTSSALTVTFPHTKGDKVMRKILPLTSAAAHALLAWLDRRGQVEGDAPVWISLAKNTRGHRLTQRALADIWQKHLGTMRVHSTRHTFAHALEKSGMPISKIQHLLGHANISTTSRYLTALADGENDKLHELERLYGLG
jgi:site-specific recombinase XerD